MIPDILILRPEPGASSTAVKAHAKGFTIASAPLFAIMARDWPPADPDAYDAVMMTSAHAARLGGMLLPAYLHLPLYAVGATTAQAARLAGFENIYTGENNADALLATMADHGVERVLHLAGEDHVPNASGWMKIDRRIVYAAEQVDPAPSLPETRFILVHSPRAGARLAEIVPADMRTSRTIVAISPAAAQACGTGWQRVASAAHPNDAVLLECVARLCKGIR